FICFRPYALTICELGIFSRLSFTAYGDPALYFGDALLFYRQLTLLFCHLLLFLRIRFLFLCNPLLDEGVLFLTVCFTSCAVRLHHLYSEGFGIPYRFCLLQKCKDQGEQRHDGKRTQDQRHHARGL